jgi:hypothetical protein
LIEVATPRGSQSSVNVQWGLPQAEELVQRVTSVSEHWRFLSASPWNPLGQGLDSRQSYALS